MKALKNKKLIPVLLVVAVGVWGLIIYRVAVYSGGGKGDDKNGGEKTRDHERGVRHVVPELPGSVFGDGSPGRETTVSPGAGKSYRGRTGFSSRVSICRENTKGETGFLVDEVGRQYAAGIRERKKR